MSEQDKKPSKIDIVFWTFAGVVISILVLAVVVPNFIKARATTAANPCVNALRQIDAAAQQFALETGKTNGEAINFPSDLTPYIKLNSAGKIPGCPQGGIYHISKVGETPTCSLDAPGKPGHALK